jgi:trans-aconitate methyltransferase
VTEFRYSTSPFGSPPSRIARMTSAALEIYDRDKALRVLDLGCGTGGQLLDLLDAFPNATGVGVDVSEPSVAEAIASATAVGGRARFLCADYLRADVGDFDLVISDSVLQLFEETDGELAGKLAGDLVPGGHLLATIPAQCAYNRILATTRRAARRIRRPSLDRMILAVGRVLHRNYPRELLRQRVEYVYLLPHRYGGPSLWRVLADCGLVVVSWRPIEHASPVQMKHGLLVARRTD